MCDDSYNDGLREGVVFLFIKDNKILLEDRSIQTRTPNDRFFPNGSVENRDKEIEGDYKLNALYREVSEEFRNQISIVKWEMVCCETVQEIGVVFYVYNITEWEGAFPTHTIENGDNYGKLQWVDIEEAERLLRYQSAKNILKQARRTKKNFAL